MLFGHDLISTSAVPRASRGQATGARSHRKRGSLLITGIPLGWFPKEMGRRKPEREAGSRRKDTAVPRVWLGLETLLERAWSSQPSLSLPPAVRVLCESLEPCAAHRDQPQPPQVPRIQEVCLQNKQVLGVLQGGLRGQQPEPLSGELARNAGSLPHLGSAQP